MSGSARSEQDDRGAAEADGGANQIPAVGLRALDRPQPQQRRGDIDPAIGGIGAPRMVGVDQRQQPGEERSEEHTSELQSLMRISYAVFCLKKKKYKHITNIMLTKYIDRNRHIVM